MQRKEFTLIAVLLVLGGLYVRYFTHWFDHEKLEITASRRPSMDQNSAVESIIFTLNGQHSLKDLKVLQLTDDGKLDPHAHVLWHLVSASNPVPAQLIVYGHHVRGMKQAVDNPSPEALQPDVGYCVVATTTQGATGSANFATRAEQ